MGGSLNMPKMIPAYNMPLNFIKVVWVMWMLPVVPELNEPHLFVTVWNTELREVKVDFFSNPTLDLFY